MCTGGPCACAPPHRSLAVSRSRAVAAAQAPVPLPCGVHLATRPPNISTGPPTHAPVSTNRFGLLSEELTELPSEAEAEDAGPPISVSNAPPTAISSPPAAREDRSVSPQRDSFWYTCCRITYSDISCCRLMCCRFMSGSVARYRLLCYRLLCYRLFFCRHTTHVTTHNTHSILSLGIVICRVAWLAAMTRSLFASDDFTTLFSEPFTYHTYHIAHPNSTLDTAFCRFTWLLATLQQVHSGNVDVDFSFTQIAEHEDVLFEFSVHVTSNVWRCYDLKREDDTAFAFPPELDRAVGDVRSAEVSLWRIRACNGTAPPSYQEIISILEDVFVALPPLCNL